MANEFKQYTLVDVGSEEQTLHTLTVKGLLVNLTIANKLHQDNTASVYLKKADDSIVYLIKNGRLKGNSANEVVKSNKIVLNIGDAICITSEVEDSCDAVASILEGVK